MIRLENVKIRDDIEDDEVYVLLSKPHSPNKLKIIGEVGVFMIRIMNV